MAGRPPEPFVFSSRPRPRVSGHALAGLFVGVVAAVTAAWFVALALLALWVIRAIF